MQEPVAIWSLRFALFAAALVVVALLLHRMGHLDTPAFVNTVGLAFLVAALAVAVGLYAGGSIWMRGRTGAWQVFLGVAGGLLVWSWPLAVLPRYVSLPTIADVSTDTTATAPAFVKLAPQRKYRGNGPAYPGAAFARQQATAYPDIRSFVVDRSVDDVHDIILDMIAGRRGFGWRVAADQPPSLKPPRPGLIEATERSMIIGFLDDIVIRIEGSETQAKVDVRSASRYGRHDFGTNAARIRRLLRELTARLESTALSGTVPRRPQFRDDGTRIPDKSVKRPIERIREKAEARRAQESAPKDARRAPAQKVQRQE